MSIEPRITRVTLHRDRMPLADAIISMDDEAARLFAGQSHRRATLVVQGDSTLATYWAADRFQREGFPIPTPLDADILVASMGPWLTDSLAAHTARLDAATALLDTPDDATAADAMTAMADAVDALHGLTPQPQPTPDPEVEFPPCQVDGCRWEGHHWHDSSGEVVVCRCYPCDEPWTPDNPLGCVTTARQPRDLPTVGQLADRMPHTIGYPGRTLAATHALGAIRAWRAEQ